MARAGDIGRDRRQGTRDRPGDRRHGASLRRPRRAPRCPRRTRRGAVIPLTLDEIAGIVGGRVEDASGPDVVVSGPAFLDSRTPEPGGLFVAFAGEHADGHDYARAAVEGGAAAVLGTRDNRRAIRARRRCPGRPPGARPRRPRAAPRDAVSPDGRRHDGLAGQDHRQGHAGPGACRRRADRGHRRLLQQRARPAAHRAAVRGADPLPRARDGRPRRRPPHRAVRDRPSRRLPGPQRWQGPHRRVRQPGADRGGQGRAGRGAPDPTAARCSTSTTRW